MICWLPETDDRLLTTFKATSFQLIVAAKSHGTTESLTRCGSSPIQMMAVSNDMPDDVAFLFRDVAADIKSIYKANMFQSAHMGRYSVLS